MAEVSIATVCHYRQRNNIPSYRSTLNEASSSPLVKTTTATAAELQGFSVTALTNTGQQRYIVVAETVLAAAQRAERRVGHIVEITHLGPAL